MGDFNINLLEHGSHNPTNNYLSSMQSMHYIPVISRPTRFPQGNERARCTVASSSSVIRRVLSKIAYVIYEEAVMI